jgi:catechol 2,3-dioxygenase-like lactoylglutathione lyase family enzyme
LNGFCLQAIGIMCNKFVTFSCQSVNAFLIINEILSIYHNAWQHDEGVEQMSFIYTGLDHVQIAAPTGCEEQARHFYGELLGMVEVPKPEPLAQRGGVWFQAGSHQLHIGVQTDFVPATKAHPAFQVENLVLLREELLAKGLFVIEDEDLPGARRFYLRDPFGNRLEFLEWL